MCAIISRICNYFKNACRYKYYYLETILPMLNSGFIGKKKASEEAFLLLSNSKSGFRRSRLRRVGMYSTLLHRYTYPMCLRQLRGPAFPKHRKG